jgi:hypothetical protein
MMENEGRKEKERGRMEERGWMNKKRKRNAQVKE